MTEEGIPGDAAWWASIERRISQDEKRKALFVCARQAWDRWQQIKLLLDDEGVLVDGRYEGMKRLNPLVGAEGTARGAVIRAINQLGLDSLRAPPSAEELEADSVID